MLASSAKYVVVQKIDMAKSKRTGPNGKCAVCRHPERGRIELMIARGAHQSSVARKYSLAKDAVYRHWRLHITEEFRVNLMIGPVERMGLAAQLAEESGDVLDHYRVIRAAVYGFLQAATDARDVALGLAAAGRLKEVCDSIAKLTGSLISGPLIQQNVVNLNVNPEFNNFKADLVRVLVHYPDAARAVMAKFQELEAQADVAVQGSSVQQALPALEHVREASQ